MPDVKGYKLPNHDETYMYADAYAREELTKLPETYAPAGYGYGDVMLRKNNITDEAALETFIEEIVNDMPDYYSTKQLDILYIPFRSYDYMCTIYKHSPDRWYIRCVSYSNGQIFIKRCVGGTWQPLEWENPPMLLGEEYRTTERWNGAVVYTKLINCGYLASVSTGAKDVAHGASIASVVNITGTLSTGDLLPYYNTSTEIQLSCTPSNIKLMSKAWGFEATTPITSIQAVVQIWYIKP